MDSLVEEIFVNLIVSEMEMDSQNVWIDNQNVTIPNTDGLFIMVGMVDSKVIANKNYSLPTDSGMTEYQELVIAENIQIDLVSRDDSALERRFEVLMALKSVLAQQKQETNNFRIFRIPTSFANTSEAEGSVFMS